MSQLANAAAALFSATSAFAGEPVTVSRASYSVSITAVPSRPETISDDMVMARIEAEAMDWTVLASQYVLNGSVVLPAEGDRITRANSEVFELMQTPYRPSDSAGVRLRLHSKRVV